MSLLVTSSTEILSMCSKYTLLFPEWKSHEWFFLVPLPHIHYLFLRMTCPNKIIWIYTKSILPRNKLLFKNGFVWGESLWLPNVNFFPISCGWCNEWVSKFNNTFLELLNVKILISIKHTIVIFVFILKFALVGFCHLGIVKLLWFVFILKNKY